MARSLMLFLAGIAIGILIAPDKGTETRKKISDKLDDYKDDAQDLVEKTAGKIKSKFQVAKGDIKSIIDEKL
jgi:gas vesicle protein